MQQNGGKYGLNASETDRESLRNYRIAELSPNFSWLEWTVALERTRHFEILARLENPDVSPAECFVGQRPITRSFAKPLSRLAIGTVHE